VIDKKTSLLDDLCLAARELFTERQLSLLFLASVAFACLEGCAVSPAAVAARKLDGMRFASTLWRGPYLRCPSFESDRVLKLEPDGTGTLSSRSFGYVKPGLKLGSSIGTGAYTQAVSWPIVWEPLGGGKIKLRCLGSHSSTGPEYFAEALPPLTYAELSKAFLLVHYKGNLRVTFVPIAPMDPGFRLSEREIKRRLDEWTEFGPQRLADSAGYVRSQSDASSFVVPLIVAPPPGAAPHMTYPQPVEIHYYGAGTGMIQAGLMNNLGRH